MACGLIYTSSRYGIYSLTVLYILIGHVKQFSGWPIKVIPLCMNVEWKNRRGTMTSENENKSVGPFAKLSDHNTRYNTANS